MQKIVHVKKNDFSWVFTERLTNIPERNVLRYFMKLLSSNIFFNINNNNKECFLSNRSVY